MEDKNDIKKYPRVRTEKELRAILGEPDEEKEIGFVLCFKGPEAWYISGNSEGIDGSYNITDLIERVEGGYDDCHSRGYESSMSACVNGITFQWSVIKVQLSKIPEMVESLGMYKCRNVSGQATGIKLLPEYAEWFNDDTKHISTQLIRYKDI